MSRSLGLSKLHDAHSHVSLYAALGDCPDISESTRDEALSSLRALPRDSLSVVLGWHSARVRFSPEELSSLPPAVIINRSFHGLLLTEAAKDFLPDSEAELVERHGDPLWCERNLPRLLSFYGRYARLTAEKLDSFMKRLEVLGVGSIEDMTVTGAQALSLIQSSRWSDRIRCWASLDVFHGLEPRKREGIEGIKLFTDGALALRTAALREPYSGGGRGLLVFTEEELAGALAEVSVLKKPVAVHALGDRAVEQVLTTLESLAREGVSFPVVRLEHAQFIDESQAGRAKALGAVLSMQPNFSADSVDYSDRLSSGLCAANNPFRMLIDRAGFKPGKDLLFGSDGMPHGAEAALRWSLSPSWDGQRLSLEELAAGYCRVGTNRLNQPRDS